MRPGRATAALGALIVVPTALAAEAEADLWWHVLAGRRILAAGDVPRADPWSYTFAGAPWIDHEWLPDLVLAAAYDGAGNFGLLAARAALLAALMLAWLDGIGRRLPGAPLGWALVALPWPLLGLLANLRPQTATWALVPVALALVDRVAAGVSWAPAALVWLVWLWANTHGGFLFGWGLAGLGFLLAAAGIEGGRRRPGLLLGAAAVAACPLANPYGPGLLAYVARELGARHPELPEWNPPEGAMIGVLAAFAAAPVGLLGLAAALGLPTGPRRPTGWVGLAVVTVAATQSAKFVALVMLLAPLCAAEPLARLWARLRARPDGEELGKLASHPAFGVGVLAAALALQAPFVVGAPGTVPVPGRLYPTQAVRWLAGARAEGRLATELGWGGIALWHLLPGWRVNVDGRNTTVFPVPFVIETSIDWHAGVPDRVLDPPPDAVLARTGDPLDRALRARGWRAAWTDPVATVLTLDPTLRGPDPGAPPAEFP